MLNLLHVVQVLVRLHVDGEVTLGCGGVVAHLTSVGLVTACVSLTPGQTRVLLASDAVDASSLTLWMFFLHVDFKCLLVFVVPVALGAF